MREQLAIQDIHPFACLVSGSIFSYTTSMFVLAQHMKSKLQ